MLLRFDLAGKFALLFRFFLSLSAVAFSLQESFYLFKGVLMLLFLALRVLWIISRHVGYFVAFEHFKFKLNKIITFKVNGVETSE